MNSCLW